MTERLLDLPVKIFADGAEPQGMAELSRQPYIHGLTAMLTRRQVTAVAAMLNPSVPSIMSVFAGRIADTGVDPSPIMKESLEIVRTLPKAELLWASVREVLNVFQAAACGCDIVTVPHDILKRLLDLEGRDLDELSLDTVRMFHRDAVAAGFKL